MWDPPEPGIKPVTPALAGGFLTARPPERPLYMHIYGYIYFNLSVEDIYMQDNDIIVIFIVMMI